MAASIDEKLCIGGIVFLSKAVQERRRGVSPAAAEHIDLWQQPRINVDSGVEPLLFAVGLNLFLAAARRQRGRRWVALDFRQRMHPIPDRTVRTVDTQKV